MQFIVNNTDPHNKKLIIEDDQGNPVFRSPLASEHDKYSWLTILSDHKRKLNNNLDNLMEHIPQLLTLLPLPTPEERTIYQDLLEGTLLWLVEEKNLANKSNDPFLWQTQYDELTHKLFLFKVDTRINNPAEENCFAISFSRSGIHGEILCLMLPRQDPTGKKFTKPEEVTIALALLRKACQGQDKNNVIRVIENYKYFRWNIDGGTTDDKDKFLCFSKAFVFLIEEGTDDIKLYKSVIPEIYSFIAEYDPDHDEQLAYIQKMLLFHEDYLSKKNRLLAIMHTLSNHLSTTPQDKLQRTEIISTISNYYLRLYDLDTSALFWDQAGNHDYIFRFLLHLHRHPRRFVLSMGVILGILFLFAYNHWKMPDHFPRFTSLTDGPSYLALFQFTPVFLLVLFFGAIITLFFLIILNVPRQKVQWLLYAQLLFPRIIGAVIVGLFPLLFNDQSWLVGIQSSLMTWLLLSLFSYVLSFIYILVEVSKTMKLAQGRSPAAALRTSFQLCCIATFETLIIITVTSVPVFSAVKTSLGNIDTSLGISIHFSPMINLDFFPLLIILWSGVALFIGTFVQLLWQGERITEPL